MSTLDYRLGIDVGGTNTDAVILDCSDQVRAKVKVPTTADLTSGIIAVLDAVVRSAGMGTSRITHAMLATTHTINALRGVDLAQARTGHDQHAIGRQIAQPGSMSVEGGTLGAGHGDDEVTARRVHETTPFAHTPILSSQQPAIHGRGHGRPVREIRGCRGTLNARNINQRLGGIRLWRECACSGCSQPITLGEARSTDLQIPIADSTLH